MTGRISETGIDPVFLDRWSPRAFDESAMEPADLMTMLDAAHWAPSAFNYQPWRFITAMRGDANWEGYLELLIPFNRSWASTASALVFFVSETVMGDPEKPSLSHSFDTGAAWAFFALQAAKMGYHVHGMTGLEFEAAQASLAIPDGWKLEAAAAVGRIGDKASLPDYLAAKEVPSTRKRLSEVVGPF